MRGLLKAIGALMQALGNATRTVAVFCWRSGKWITKTMVVAPSAALDSIGAGGGGAMAPDQAVETSFPTSGGNVMAEHLDRIKRLAVGLAAGVAPASLFEDVPDNAIEWLTAMDREMLCQVACANDADLAAHLTGKVNLIGVLIYDQEAVADYRVQAIGAVPDQEPECEIKPSLAA